MAITSVHLSNMSRFAVHDERDGNASKSISVAQENLDGDEDPKGPIEII
jgi:hypothetical protein